jgi:cysteine sulfinate desulfinase/cysteine desulfurase-like protein
VHKDLGTFDAGGTVRFSLGPFSSATDIDAVLQAMTAIAG